jgi:hypothetical protein
MSGWGSSKRDGVRRRTNYERTGMFRYISMKHRECSMIAPLRLIGMIVAWR